MARFCVRPERRHDEGVGSYPFFEVKSPSMYRWIMSEMSVFDKGCRLIGADVGVSSQGLVLGTCPALIPTAAPRLKNRLFPCRFV